jgi:protocatechuate 3,4-dioxygenase beta subunit
MLASGSFASRKERVMQRLLFLLLLVVPAPGALTLSNGLQTAGGQAVTSSSQQQQQQPPAQQEAEKKEPGRIEGTVVLATSGGPVRKAQVNIFSQERRTPLMAATNEEGKFVFERVPAGDYRINVNHSRFVGIDESGRSRETSRRISVAEGQLVKGLVFKMMPGAVVTGRVLDEYGEPQPRANVNVQRYVFRQGKKQLMPMSSGQSDDRGEYRLFGVPPGRYYLSVHYEDHQWARSVQPAGAQESSYPPVYYPGVLETEMAMVLDLRAGEERQGIDFRLVRDRAVRIKGRVMEGGKPARETVVMLVQKGLIDFGGMKNQPVDSNTGEFEFSGVRPGTYTLVARKMGAGPEEALVGRTEASVGPSNVEGLVIALSTGTNVPGQVVIEGDNAAPIPFEEKTTRVFLEPSDRVGFFGGYSPGLVKADGSFELRRVTGGTYRARLMPVPDGGYLAGAMFGDQDVTGQEFEILPGMQGPLKIRIRMAAATITGMAKDDKGKPAPNIQVVVAPEPSKRGQEDLFRLESTDQYGRFTAKGLPPGDYSLWAVSKIEHGQHTDPDFLALIEKESEKVRAEEKGSHNVELKIIEVPGVQ